MWDDGSSKNQTHGRVLERDETDKSVAIERRLDKLEPDGILARRKEELCGRDAAMTTAGHVVVRAVVANLELVVDLVVLSISTKVGDAPLKDPLGGPLDEERERSVRVSLLDDDERRLRLAVEGHRCEKNSGSATGTSISGFRLTVDDGTRSSTCVVVASGNVLGREARQARLGGVAEDLALGEWDVGPDRQMKDECSNLGSFQ